MRLLEERIPADLRLTEETPVIDDVYCNRCGQMIGRLQTIPAEPEADMEEIYAELRLIAAEHRDICPAR
jgi:hypothetical protein